MNYIFYVKIKDVVNLYNSLSSYIKTNKETFKASLSEWNYPKYVIIISCISALGKALF